MLVFRLKAGFMLLAAMSTAASYADEKIQGVDTFKPYKLVGGWKFVNSSTGRNYGGDIEVEVSRVDEKGIMHGRISYDGRQSNDRCGTKPLFTDTPVEAEIVKLNKEYRITFQANCQVGVSPRTFSWTLLCDDDGVCSFPTALPWGNGVTTLTEKAQ